MPLLPPPCRGALEGSSHHHRPQTSQWRVVEAPPAVVVAVQQALRPVALQALRPVALQALRPVA